MSFREFCSSVALGSRADPLFVRRMSLGYIISSDLPSLEQRVLSKIAEQGVVVVVAAGNEGAAGVSRYLAPYTLPPKLRRRLMRCYNNLTLQMFYPEAPSSAFGAISAANVIRCVSFSFLSSARSD